MFLRCLLTICIFLSIGLTINHAFAQVPTSYEHLAASQWQLDLVELDADIRRYHINPFWFNDEVGYKRLYKEAQDYISHAKPIDTNKVNAYLEKLVAYISDGHSYVVDKSGRFGLLSFDLEWFGDYIYLIALAHEDQDYLGAKVIAFDGMTVKEANKRIMRFIPVVNSSSFKFHTKDAYHFAGLLYAAGISKNKTTVELTLQLPKGEQVKKVFSLRNNTKKFIDLQEPQGITIPLYRQQQDKFQWLTYLEKEQVVYLRYARVMEKSSGDISLIASQLTQILSNRPVQKLIVDVRDNGGGDSYLNAPLIKAIAANPSINQPGKLFVLTNHNTFSAAINFAGNMEIKTKALFVGEKVADRASFAGEAGPQARHILPNSGIAVSLSFSEWNTTYDGDMRDAVGLNIPINTTMQDFLLGRDPVLQTCLDYVPPKAPVANTDYSRWIGRYDYSLDKALRVYSSKDGLQMEVTEQIFSSLYPQGKNILKTDMAGISLKLLVNGDLELLQMESKSRVLHRLGDDQLKPLELLMADQFYAAQAAYQKVRNENTKLLSIRGNSLGILASHIRARYGSSKYYDQLRTIAVSLYGEPIASWDLDE